MAESIVTVVARHMGSMIKDEANRLSDVEAEVDHLRSELMEMKERLVEAEKEELAYDEQVRGLRAELRQIAYEAEDVVDTIALKSSSSSSRSLISRLPRVTKLGASRQQLRELKTRMEDVNKKLDRYVSRSYSLDSPKAPRGLGWQLSEDHLIHPEDHDFVVAINDDVENLVQKLVVNKSHRCFDVLAIVGMGGSGKTTLARRIYSHRVVKRHFDCQAWVTLTQQWDTSAVLLDILRQAADDSKMHRQIATNAKKVAHRFDLLETHLQHVLIGKRCLIVLDDVWRSDSLSKILDMLTEHSEIIITSRNLVLSDPDSRLKWSFHEIRCLSQVHSWELFDKIARTRGKKGLDKEYKVLGTEMLKRCQGLPLAIVALANLLKTKFTIEEWERVFSQIEGARGTSLYRPVNDILALSFEELPQYLKPCFLYLGLFPQGSRISAGMLIRMWIAEGFVGMDEPEPEPELTLEEAARRCLKGLIDHTMVQVERTNYAGQVTTIRVHDIMRDLCLFKARELDFLSIFPLDSQINAMTSRRAAIDLSMHFTLPVQNSQFRSLVLFGESKPNSGADEYVTYTKRNQATLNLIDICENFKLLRVLDLSRIKTSDGTLPKQIGSLIHLRYLRMRSTNIRELPKSMEKLRNLLTLDYWDVYGDSEVTIPNVLWRLRCLRHLYLPNEMSRSAKGEFQLHTITDLQTLWGVRGGDWMIKDINDWSFSLKKLFIHGISTYKQLDAVQCFIKRQDHLYALALDWYNTELHNLDALSSKGKLRKLRLMGKAPDRLGPINFPGYLQKLELYYTQLEKPETLEALGRLHSLRFLRLSKDSYIGSKWTCSENAFPKLEELKLSNLQLVDWETEKGSMPCLKKLSIVSCSKLSNIPQGLKYIISLEKLEIERMPHHFCTRLQHVKESKAIKQGEDFHIIQHIADVKIRDACSF